MAKSRARKLADIIVGAGIDIDGNLTFDGGSTSADLTFADNDKANFGDASDLQIYHDGSNSYIKDTGTGDLIVEGSNNIWLMKAGGSEVFLNTYDDGTVQLYHDNSVKLATTSTGVTITGTLVADGLTMGDNELIQLGTGNDLRIYHDGSHSRILENGTGNLIIQGTNLDLADTATGETFLRAVSNDSVEIYYDGSKKFETTSTGISVTGDVDIPDGNYLDLGSGGLTLRTNANNAYITESTSGKLAIQGQNIELANTAGTETFAYFSVDGAATLYYDNSAKLATTSTGVDVTGTVTADSLTVGDSHTIGNGTGDNLFIQSSSGENITLRAGSTREILLQTNNSSGNAVQIYANNDVAFYEDTGNTPKLFWDASAELLEVSSTGNGYAFRPSSTSSDYALMHVQAQDGTALAAIRLDGSSGLRFHTNGTNNTAEKMRIDSSGNVGIGTTSPSSMLHLQDSSDPIEIRLEPQGQANYPKLVGASAAGTNDTYFAVDFVTRGEALRVDGETGNVGIGTTAPSFAAINSVSSGIKGIEIFNNGTDTASALKLAGDNGSGTKAYAQVGYSGANATAHFANYNTSGTKVGEIVIGSTGNVGIGTTSPGTELHVTSAGNNTYSSTVTKGTNHTGLSIVQEGGNTDMTGVFFGSGGSGTGSHWSAITGSRTNHSAHWGTQLNFYTHANNTSNLADATQKMIITGDGNVGIGTTSPEKNLSIGSSQAEGIQFNYDTTNNYRNQILNYWNSSTDSRMDFNVARASGQTPQTIMSVGYNNNVGIGTTSPQGLLHAADSKGSAGNLWTQVGAGNAPSIHIQNTANVANTNAAIYFRNSVGEKASIGARFVNQSTGETELRFSTTNSSGSAFEKMVLDGDGNVGIGTIDPNAKLQVHIAAAGTASNIVAAGTGAGIYLEDDETPTKPYFVSKIHNPGNYTAIGGIKFAVSPDAANYSWSGIKAFTSTSGAAGDLVFYTSGGNTTADSSTERMRIDSAGRVGIKTTPSAWTTDYAVIDLNTGGSIYGTTAGISASSNLYFNGSSWLAKTTGLGTLYAAYSGQHIWYSSASVSAGSAATLSTKMILDSAGKLGIGTSSPGAPLEVHSNVSLPIIRARFNAGYYTDYNSNGITFNGSSQNFNIADNGTSRLYIKSGGNVGIGATSPLAKLQVAGSELFMHGGTTTTGPGIFLGDNNFANSSYYNSAPGIGAVGPYGGVSAGLALYVYGSQANSRNEAMRIDNTGKVGIGRTSPNAKLDINAGTTKGIEIALGTSSVPFINFLYGATTVGSITTTGSATVYNTSSDQRLKENIVDAPSASDDIDAIQVRSFDWKADGSHQKYGMVAQELQSVAPEAVTAPEDPEEMMAVDYSKLVPMLVKEIQSLRARVAELEGE